MKLVDTHAHVISRDTQRYPLRDPADERVKAFLIEPFTVEHLLAQMDANDVTSALLVQRGQLYGYDNDYVCAAVASAPERLRSICAIDGSRRDCGAIAESWLRRGAAGFRLMQSSPNADLKWLGGDHAAALWRLSCEHSLPLGVHFWPGNRDHGVRMLNSMMDTFPDAVVVVDHFSNCPLSSDGALNVDDGLRALADRPNVLMKVTTIPLGRMAKEGLSFKPLMDSARKLFGTERLLWGSDIGQSPGSYEQMVSFGKEAVGALSAPEQQAVLAENARRIYRLN